MKRIVALDLPEQALGAAAAFHVRILPLVRHAAEEDIVILFAAADHTHEGWRRAAVQELAREAAPCRVNAIAGGDAASTELICAYLEKAPGVTGQVLAADALSS